MKALVTGAFREYDKLKQLFGDIYFDFVKNENEQLNTEVSEFELVICNSLFLKNDIKSFKSLKYIQVTSAGLDRLPMDYIQEKGIKVFNARGVYSTPIAEWVICKILDVYKNTFKFNENQINKIWEKDRNIEEIAGKNVAIIGYGSVGQEIAKRLKAFDCNIIAVDKDVVSSQLLSDSYGIKELDRAISQADIICLTLPLTQETKNLFDKNIFAKINNNPILINVARGGLINESDLIVYSKKFRAVILDVFETEPLSKDSELWSLDNIIITPHNSFVSQNNNDRLYDVVVNNLRSVINE